MPRTGIRIVPNDQSPSIMTRGAIDLRVILVLLGANANRRVMAIGAIRWRSMRAMTLRTFPAIVGR